MPRKFFVGSNIKKQAIFSYKMKDVFLNAI